MTILEFRRDALGTYMAVALLAGCGGSQPPIGAPGAMPQTSALATHAERGVASLKQGASGSDLLYVTDDHFVTVYSYPQAKLVGTLTGFHNAVGECVDSTGDVYIPGYSKQHRVAEFAHGGTKPIALLKPVRVVPVGCSVDPTSGNLALSGSGNPPVVDVFKQARGKPALYRPSGLVYVDFCAYDGKGNLFVLGLQSFKGKPLLVELSKGADKFVPINLNATVDGEGALQWDGKYLAIESYIHAGSASQTPVIKRFAVSGNRGRVVGKTILGPPAYAILQFDIFDQTILVPNWYFPGSGEKFNVLGYSYPEGGSPKLTITKHLSFPRGVVLSRAAR